MLSFRSSPEAQDSLVSANTYLRSARNSPGRKQALEFCRAAKKELVRIKVSANTTYLDQIVEAYREHGRVLEKLGLIGEATRSYNAADKLEQNKSRASNRGSSLVPFARSSTSQPAFLSSVGNTIHDGSPDLFQGRIFANDYHPQLFKGTPPKPDEDLTDTRQLAYCLALLQASPAPYDSLDEPTRIWLHKTEYNEDEQERLKTIATDLLLEFRRSGLEDDKKTAEIACIAPVLESDNYRILLGIFVDGLKDSAFLPVHALEGLDSTIKCASPGCMDPDDLIKILEHLNSRLQSTYTQSLDHVYRLTRTVSHILDAMVDGDIKDLGREKLHTPLLLYSKELQKHTDPYMVFQAAYAFQALLRVPNEENPWQTTLRHTGIVVKGTARLFRAVKGFDVDKFIDTAQGGLEVAGQILKDVGEAYKDFSALKKSGQELRKALKTSFNRKRVWYTMLRGIDTLLQNGELTKVKTIICNAPCRRELAFQWGVCQRLGILAADTNWDTCSREGAVAFLGEIYQNDAIWGQEAKVKQCILDILMQLARKSGGVKKATDDLLQEFAKDGDVRKRTLYDASQKEGPSSHLWKVALPLLSSSPLLDTVQKTPAVEADLRKFGRVRLHELGDAIYVAPEAKPHRYAPDDDLFDLTTKAKEFLDSEKKVLLIWGDSGSGKSTFNKELERELWSDYNNCNDRILRKQKKIPIFVILPAIDKPESDLIGKQLLKAGFGDAQIKELKAKRKFVLICDGYDEYQQMRNLYDIYELNRPGQWKAQMVITCRSEYLGLDYHHLFQPEDRCDQTGEALLQEAVIARFSKKQIQAYIEKYVNKDAPRWEAKEALRWEVEDYLRVFDQTPSLQELVTNPFLLSLSIRVLPGMADLGNDFSPIKVTRVMLYDRFIEQWVEQGKKRLIKRELLGNEKKVFEILSADSFSRNAISFVKKLAVAIFENQDGIPVVEYSSDEEEDVWKVEFFGQDDSKKLLREACPLHRYDNQHRFIHKSLLEYCLARAVFEPQQRREYRTTGEKTTVPGREGSKHHGGEKVMSVVAVSAPDVNSPLFRKSFVDKPAVLQFLAERVPQEPVFKQQLHVYIENSKTDKKWCIAAANAITILIRAGVRFNQGDLRGIQVPGADLSGGEFDSAQLQGADLRNVNLRDIWLRQANLSNAQMSGVQFSEWPYLEENSEVLSCTYSQDGRTCAVGLSDGMISVYNASNWVRIHTLRGHIKDVTSVAYSPSGRQIASGSVDKTVRLWDVQTGAPGPILRGHTDHVTSVAYSPSEHNIASGSWDNTVRLWDVQTGAPGSIFSGHTDIVTSVAYSPSGHQIASGSADTTVHLWNAQAGVTGLILRGHTDEVTCVTYSPSGLQIMSGSEDRTVRLWDAQTGAPGPILSGHIGNVTSVTYSPSGHQIASGSEDNTVRLFDTQTGAPGRILSGHTYWVRSVTYSPNGHQIASGSADRTVRLWDTQTGAPCPVLSGHTDWVWSVAYSPSGHQIASGSRDKTLRLWNAQKGASSSILSGHTDWVRSVTYLPNGHQIASGSDDKTVRLWDAQTGAPGAILCGHTHFIQSVAYSPSGHQLASGSNDKTVRLWDAQTGAPGHTLSGHTSFVTSVTYSPSGHQIASGSLDNTIRLWNAQTGMPGPILSGHKGSIASVTYSPSGHQIASGSWDNTVWLWDAQTGAPGPILSGHTDAVNSVKYSPSGHQIASGSDDSTVRLWGVHSAQCLVIVKDFSTGIKSIAWSATLDGIYFVTGSNSIRAWEVIEGQDDYEVRLRWRSMHGGLALSDACMQDAQGLSSINIQLLRQRGAVGEPIPPLSICEAS